VYVILKVEINVFFLLLHRAFWYMYSSLTNKCTFINLQNTLQFTLKYT